MNSIDLFDVNVLGPTVIDDTPWWIVQTDDDVRCVSAIDPTAEPRWHIPSGRSQYDGMRWRNGRLLQTEQWIFIRAKEENWITCIDKRSGEYAQSECASGGLYALTVDDVDYVWVIGLERLTLYRLVGSALEWVREMPRPSYQLRSLRGKYLCLEDQRDWTWVLIQIPVCGQSIETTYRLPDYSFSRLAVPRRAMLQEARAPTMVFICGAQVYQCAPNAVAERTGTLPAAARALVHYRGEVYVHVENGTLVARDGGRALDIDADDQVVVFGNRIVTVRRDGVGFAEAETRWPTAERAQYVHKLGRYLFCVGKGSLLGVVAIE